jgi:hypothetical protein
MGNTSFDRRFDRPVGNFIEAESALLEDTEQKNTKSALEPETLPC